MEDNYRLLLVNIYYLYMEDKSSVVSSEKFIL